jgi:prolipoprotein diacylglyceryltransferase
LFGRPSDLPWAIRIAPENRPVGFADAASFHPTFLYESIWCLLVAGAIVYAEKRFTLRRGQSFALYVALYTFGRIFFEWLRVDPASELFGIRFNLLLSAVLCAGGIVAFLWYGRRQPVAASATARDGGTVLDERADEPSAPS